MIEGILGALAVYIGVWFSIYSISNLFVKDKVLGYILPSVFLFQFLIFPKDIAFIGETFGYYISVVYGILPIPLTSPISFLIMIFMIKLLNIPEYIALDIIRGVFTTLSTLFVYKIVLHVYKKRIIGIVSSILFGFSYVQFFYMAGDQYKNLIANTFFIILIYILLKKINIKCNNKDFMLISILSILCILSHNFYIYIIPFIGVMFLLINKNVIKKYKELIIFSLVLPFLLVLYKYFTFIHIKFVDRYLKYGNDLGIYHIVDGFNHLGNTLFFILGLYIVLYIVFINKIINKKCLFLFFTFFQLFILGNMYFIGIKSCTIQIY